MTSVRLLARSALVVSLLGLGACATTIENAVKPPSLALTDVRVVGLGFNGQTFLLSFEIENPNGFSLPVESVRYDLRLDGQRFASGSTTCDVAVPALGKTNFGMSVELDLLHTAPQLLSIVREGARRDIPYEVSGEFGLDLPLSPTVRYRSTGMVQLRSDTF